jgi:hypothetical protein
MGLKHGMKLAAISGREWSVFSDDDIARVRELALAARAKSAVLPVKVARRKSPAKTSVSAGTTVPTPEPTAPVKVTRRKTPRKVRPVPSP